MHSDELLGELHEQLATRVQALTELSEHGIYGAGEALQRIVEVSQDHQQTLAVDLTTLEDHAAHLGTDKLEALRHAHEALSGKMERLLQERGALLDRCESLLRTLSRQSQNLDAIAGASKIMTLLARVESAHIGQKGQLFESTIEEMSALDASMAGLTHDLTSLQEKLKKAMPRLREGSVALKHATDEYRAWWPTETDRIQTRSTELAHTSRTGAMETAERARKLGDITLTTLSHLQFQDPMIQQLQQLDVQVNRVRNRACGADSEASFRANLGMNAFVEGRAEDEPAVDEAGGSVLLFDDDDDDDAVDAGELLLF